MIIDLRSDTVTKPSKGMLAAMASASVGDDVFGEDPTVNELQRFGAEMFGMEAALYCSSGTQTNQIAINVHTRPGDEVICSSVAHVYVYEGGGIAQNSGASVRLIDGDRGRISAKNILDNINADDAHFPRTTLICIEDTCNKGGGSVYDMEELQRIHQLCQQKGLKLHCDGARIFNALEATQVSPLEFGKLFDSISVCLSKGLGAPVGSLLLGPRDFIYRAHRRRKSFGGGMRQAGFIAAAGLYALHENIERLQDDHIRAKSLATMLQDCDWVKSIFPVDTNIVIAEVAEGLNSAMVMQALADLDIKCFTFGNDKLRLVTHLDFGDDHLREFGIRIRTIFKSKLAAASPVRKAGMY